MIKSNLVVAVVIAMGGAFVTLAHTPAPAPDRPTRYDLDGVDPMDAGCVADATKVEESEI